LRADKPAHPESTGKEVTLFNRVTMVALVVAALLVLAVPALGFNGYRGDYTATPACRTCHSGTAGISNVYPQRHGTKHAIDEEADSAALSLPSGSVCAGCHTSNYAPGKVTPVPTATSSTGVVSWVASASATTAAQTMGEVAKKGAWFGRGFMPGDGGLDLEAFGVYVKVRVK
jgi:hypothetical protein